MKKYDLVAVFRDQTLSDNDREQLIISAFEKGDVTEHEIAAAQYVAALLNAPARTQDHTVSQGKWLTEWFARNTSYKGAE